MKNLTTLTTIVAMLIIAIHCYGYDRPFIHEMTWDYDNQFEGFEFNPEFEHYFYETETYKCIMFTGFKENGEYKLMWKNFYPLHYQIQEYDGFYEDSFIKSDGSNKLYLNIYFFEDNSDIKIHDIDEEIVDSYSRRVSFLDYNLSRHFELREEDNYCIHSIEIVAHVDVKNPDELENYKLDLEFISITNLKLLNPEYENLCEAYWQGEYNVTSNQDIDYKLYLYYGYPTQLVDIYIAFYNGEELTFYPSLTAEVEFIRMVLPQYTMTKDWIYIITLNTDNLNLKEGDSNKYTIGIAPAGTLDFFHELMITTMNYTP